VEGLEVNDAVNHTMLPSLRWSNTARALAIVALADALFGWLSC
jgi:hypothetical protein